MRILFSLIILTLSACASLPKGASDALGSPDVAGTRFGLVVMTMDGRELVSIRPDERFLPASNTKLFTVAAAFHRLGDVSVPDPAAGASVQVVERGDPPSSLPPNVNLVGGGDAMLIDADDCERDCLSVLADAVVTHGLKEVNYVVGVDTRFPDERHGEGWSQEDLLFRAGAPASALTVNSNEIVLEVRPGAAVGDYVDVQWRGRDENALLRSLFTDAVTVEGREDKLRVYMSASGLFRLYGSLGIEAGPSTIPIALEDPPHSAAMRFKVLLEERGIDVGPVLTKRRWPEIETGIPKPPLPDLPEGTEIARLVPPPLIDDLRFLTKQSQNQHAEMLLRRLGLIEGSGSVRDGLAVVEAMLNTSGADRRAWDFSDGSGMSVYNRVTPRMVARFLLWTTKQPWAADFRSTLAVGGVDGTIARRFRGTPLEGRIFAKTGTLNSTNALSGFMETKSGKTLIFSFIANDRPSGATPATVAMDQALLAIAAAH
jgi:serine-type D-Ala-D-Ala carboxypeptidase/endopeptidase (penicillin-binding protein 4)